MSTDLDPARLHARGLEASLSGQLGVAEILLTQARAGFLGTGPYIDIGRVDRDLARVYAGLGEPALRDMSIENAFVIHWENYTKTPDDAVVASELAATELVRARIAPAHMVERHERYPYGIGGMLRMAHRLLGADGSNQDYLEQVVVHGSLALTTLGRHGELHLAAELLHDPVVEKITNPKRRKAVDMASKLLTARQIFIPIHLLPNVREKVIGAVAGPYLTKE